VTFGEAMVRLVSPDFMRLENATTLLATAGGAELNVAVNSANIGLKTAWVSRLVDNWSGRFIRNKGRELGVDVSHIIWTDFDGVGRERNGFYHLELGAGPRASNVTYDRHIQYSTGRGRLGFHICRCEMVSSKWDYAGTIRINCCCLKGGVRNSSINRT